ncbi:hypothetical protein PCANC_24457 [Puccinia coronata f. sp. avenae]|uniref:Uncharacterized protein n=1 Tax=Puccinia coronata f. sp. avenae TaxID=200324 RepID=A0A2N5S996_9BASI|nr:hypothetical protein PCANC_24457 [Puccinia coronata f. sp. avenae]
MKTRSFSPWALAILVSTAFIGHTLAGPYHSPIPGCNGDLPLHPVTTYEQDMCEGVDFVNGFPVNCRNIHRFQVVRLHCPNCRHSFSESWTKVQGCFAHNHLVSLPQRASRM